MAIDSTLSSTGAGAVRASASQSAMGKLSADYNSFLTLLTAQITNQNPLEPMDSTAFVSQLAQLTQVEQSIVANANLEDISSRLAATGAMSDVMLLGRQVTLATDRMALRDGEGAFFYELARPASSAKAVIRHADGTVLRELTGLPTAAGTRHSVVWDGRDSAGLPVPDGQFSVSIVAQDAAGDAVGASGYATALVERLLFRSGQAVLALSNGLEIASSNVVAVE